MGALLVGLEAGFSKILPAYMTGAVLVAALVVATRGLHLDGLMDVSDGLFGGYTRERRLEIMRDPRVGAFAVAGALCIVLLKWTAVLSLITLPESSGKMDLPWKGLALLLFPILSRWAMVLQISAFPYARAQGLGAAFRQGGQLIPTLAGAVIALAASLLLAGLGGLALFGMATALAWLMGKWMSAMLGGLTGDTYGATNEVAEVAVLGTAVALMPHDLITPLHDLVRGA